MKYAIFALALILPGCETPTVSPESAALRATEYVCVSAKAALDTVIKLDAKLIPAQRQSVSQAVMVINPVCSPLTPPTLSDTARNALNGALTQLTAVASDVSK